VVSAEFSDGHYKKGGGRLTLLFHDHSSYVLWESLYTSRLKKHAVRINQWLAKNQRLGEHQSFITPSQEGQKKGDTAALLDTLTYGDWFMTQIAEGNEREVSRALARAASMPTDELHGPDRHNGRYLKRRLLRK
jgi:hypothetical protein